MNNNLSFSVIMPTYNQCTFIRRAILSLFQQSYPFWELIIINDGSTDETDLYIKDYLNDKRVTYFKNTKNMGLGVALNQGIDAAKYEYIAYLPSDDYYFRNHLETISEKYSSQNTILVYSGIQFYDNDSLQSSKTTNTNSIIKGYCLQLVQTSHKKVSVRWTQRNEWISDNLFAMYWVKLISLGHFVATNRITAYWTMHPNQRHLLISEKYGGNINKVRRHYMIDTPMKIRLSKRKFLDEYDIYKKYQNKFVKSDESMKILLVGELSYNPERIYALEEAGHELFGLWLPSPIMSLSNIGPFPFGHIHEINVNNWKKEVEEIKPSIIYAMTNWESISFVYDVVKELPEIPYVWHYKEGPQIAIRSGLWNKLLYLYNNATVRIYINSTVKQWYEQFIPTKGVSFIMDADLPKKEVFNNSFSRKLSDTDGEIHTLCIGRIIGIQSNDILNLMKCHIHFHIYCENDNPIDNMKLEYYKKCAPNYFHIHSRCSSEKWTKEFSKYDAGWLHCFRSQNNNELIRANWDDLNIPARVSTYMVAGLPMILFNNEGNIVAIQKCIKELEIGVLFDTIDELAIKLYNKPYMNRLKKNVITNRYRFSFDYYLPQLIQLFKEAVKKQTKWNN